jgi:hypothetical protein
MNKLNLQAASSSENRPETESPTAQAASSSEDRPETESPTAPSILPPNPFTNLDAMRLSQDFVTETRVKTLLTTVPVRKPRQQEFFRVNPDPAYQLPAAAIIELNDDRELYFVHPTIVPEVTGHAIAYIDWSAQEVGIAEFANDKS